jgi:WD40 repeat protein
LLALSADGKLIAATTGHGGRILDTIDGKELCQFEEPTGKPATQATVNSTLEHRRKYTFSPDGKVLAGTLGMGSPLGPCVSGAFLWDVAKGKELACLTRSSDALAFSPDGKTVAVATANAVRLYDVASGKELRRGAGPDRPARLIGLSSDGRTLVTADNSSSIVVWDTATGKQRRRLEMNAEGVTGLLLSADGRTLVCTGQKSLRVWDVATSRELHKFEHAYHPGSTPLVRLLACSPDGKLIVITKGNPLLQLVDTTTGQSILDLAHNSNVYGSVEYAQAAFLPDGQSLLVCRGGQAQVCDLRTGKAIRQIEPGEKWLRHNWCAFSPDRRLIAFHANHMILVHELAGGTEVCRGEEPAAPPANYLLALSPDGRTVAWGSATDPLVHLRDVATGRERHAFDGHSGGIVSLAFSADGKKLVSSSTDTTLLV